MPEQRWRCPSLGFAGAAPETQNPKPGISRLFWGVYRAHTRRLMELQAHVPSPVRLMVNPKKLTTGLRTTSAGIAYTLLLGIEASGFPTFGLLLYKIVIAHRSTLHDQGASHI